MFVKFESHSTRVVLDSFFRTDSTLTHMTIQVTQLRLNSNHKFANLTPTHLSESWVKSDSRLITFYLIWEKVVDRRGGRSNLAVAWFFLCNVTDNCKILTSSPRKIIASTLTQVSSWLNSDSNDDQRDSTLTRLIFLIFTTDSTLTRLNWVRVESNLTHDSWVEHNPAADSSF